jgi:hypothetical protein
MMEFHISRDARNRYQFAETLFSFTGNVVFANVAASREFAHRMNLVRDVKNHPELAVNAGALYVMGLIDEASHAVMASYRQRLDPNVMVDALSFFSEQVGSEALEKMLLTFVQRFPGSTVYRGEHTAEEWLAGSTAGISHRAAAIEEMMLLWMANRNTAFRPFEELFEDSTLAEKTAYRRVAEQFPTYFATRPLIPIAGAAPVNLFDLLRAPAVTAPGSLSEQLSVIRSKWVSLLGEGLQKCLPEIYCMKKTWRFGCVSILPMLNRKPPPGLPQPRPPRKQPAAVARWEHSSGRRLPATPMCQVSVTLPSNMRSSVPTWHGCRPPFWSPRVHTSGLRSFLENTAEPLIASIRFPMKISIYWRGED